MPDIPAKNRHSNALNVVINEKSTGGNCAFMTGKRNIGRA